MIRTVLAGVFGAVVISGVAAAQTPSPWQGCYAGLDAGGGGVNQDAQVTTTGLNQFSPTTTNLDTTGALGGGFVGCQVPLGGSSFVVGAEGDFTIADFDETSTEANLFANGAPVGSGGIDFERDLNFLGTIRGRAGFAAGNSLFFATGGLAIADLGYKGTNTFVGGCPNCGSNSVSDTEFGVVVGGGADVAFGAHWLVGAEFLYYHFDGDSFDTFFQTAPASNSGTFSFGDLDLYTGRVRAGVRF